MQSKEFSLQEEQMIQKCPLDGGFIQTGTTVVCAQSGRR
jgi:hypothetical protein